MKDLEEKGSSWHRSCYKGVAQTGMIKRAKERYERELSGPSESRRKSRSGADSITPGCSHLTRSQTSPLNKAACFSCDGQDCTDFSVTSCIQRNSYWQTTSPMKP